MKPRVYSQIWRDLRTAVQTRRWHVAFTDSCGCDMDEDFPSFAVALRFALHVSQGGSRWEYRA